MRWVVSEHILPFFTRLPVCLLANATMFHCDHVPPLIYFRYTLCYIQCMYSHRRQTSRDHTSWRR